MSDEIHQHGMGCCIMAGCTGAFDGGRITKRRVGHTNRTSHLDRGRLTDDEITHAKNMNLETFASSIHNIKTHLLTMLIRLSPFSVEHAVAQW